jgi:hypothetical protein
MEEKKQKKDLSMILTRVVCYFNMICLVIIITHEWGLEAGVLACGLAIVSIIYSYIRIITVHKQRLDKIVRDAEKEVKKLHERRF